MKLNQIFRSLIRNPLNSLIIIISLAIGMACTNLIMLFITRELNTDSFQQNRDRIYLLKCDNPFEKGSQMSNCKKGGAEYIKENFSQVEDFCRIRFTRTQKVMIGNQIYNDNLAVFETSAIFFNVFSYKLLTNNPNSALTYQTKYKTFISSGQQEYQRHDSCVLFQILNYEVCYCTIDKTSSS